MAGDTPRPQRAWRAACPNCGAPVDFRSASSASAVCSFCRSTLVRDGETLKRIGQSAELFDDHSPLQLGANGRSQGVSFTLVGRLQYGYADGTWNEWHALFDNGRSAWLSEDNGAYVLSFDTPLIGQPPPAADLRPGQSLTLGGSVWDIASVLPARLLAAQGELPRPPGAPIEFIVADLRNMVGEVATLDYGDPAQVQFSLGRSTTLTELQMQGLAEHSEKTLGGGRALNCPSCGASIEPKLEATQSMVCGQCHAVVDLSQGAAGELKHQAQQLKPNGARVQHIALGATGRLALVAGEPLDWQCVGWQARCDIPEDSGESPTWWTEYLLFNRLAGFSFLVDTEDGWSLVRPLTGAPKVKGAQATWQGEPYLKSYSYSAKVGWVEGEFYWRVKRDERALVTDFVGNGKAKGKLLSREQTGQEVTWSGGRQLSSDDVAKAFNLSPDALARGGADVKPLAGKSGGLTVKGVLILVVILILVAMMMAMCSQDDCSRVSSTFGPNSAEYQQCLKSRSTGGRTGGSSFGGYSSGGGHK